MRVLSTFLAVSLLCFSGGLLAADAKKKPRTKANQVSAVQPAAGPSYAKRPEINDWAEQTAKTYQLDVKWVKAQLAQARFIPSIPKLILPPTQINKKNWAAYQARFI